MLAGALRRVLATLPVLILLVLPFVAAYGVAQNWFERFTGRLYSEAEIDQARAEAYERGFREGNADGYQEGYREGVREGETKGERLGRSEGYSEGWRAGCLALFEALETDRVMDFWVFHRGALSARYFTIDVCG